MLAENSFDTRWSFDVLKLLIQKSVRNLQLGTAVVWADCDYNQTWVSDVTAFVFSDVIFIYQDSVFSQETSQESDLLHTLDLLMSISYNICR